MADVFANIAHLAVTESAANTLTFEKLETGAGIFEKMAMIIHRVEYEPSAATLNLVVDNPDYFQFAWTSSDQLTALAKESPNVIDEMRIGIIEVGGPGTEPQWIKTPFIHDFTTLPSGGLIVPATHLYCAIQGTSVASPGYLRSTVYFTYKQLKGEEYWELVEATRALT